MSVPHGVGIAVPGPHCGVTEGEQGALGGEGARQVAARIEASLWSQSLSVMSWGKCV